MTLGRLARLVADGGKLMIGVPSYDAYRAHMRDRHPDAVAMTYAEFFRDRQDARYGAGARKGGCVRCC